jgi:thiol-disulfide isomerase/thioredoxin
MMNRIIWAALLLVIFTLVPQANRTQSLAGERKKQIERVAERSIVRPLRFNLLDAEGRNHSDQEWKGARAVVLLFLATECPISNRYAPEIKRLVGEYAAGGVAFYGVNSDPDIGEHAARRHSRSYGFDFPVLMDPAQTLARRTGVDLTPTAVVLSPVGRLLYRGRIDNRNLDFGKYRDAGVQPDLRLAIDAVIAGRPVAAPFTKAIGCVLPPPGELSTNRNK